jgi:DNA-binding MarR family transcriptional regulator
VARGLWNCLAASVSSESAKGLQDLGLKVQPTRVLVSLLGRGKLRCSVLARLVGMEATALSHLLRAMSDQELIVRERVKKDNRAVEVRLTEKGELLARKGSAVLNQQNHVLLTGLSAAELAQLKASLSKMRDNIRPGKSPAD